MTDNFWKNKTIGIMGGASFIASHTIDRLLNLGAFSIWIADDFSSGNKKNVPKGIPIMEGDLRDYEFARTAVDGADIILDFSSVHGGRGYVGTDHDVPISDNFVLNTNVLRASVAAKVKKIAFSSSACVYDITKQMDETANFRIPETWDDHNAHMFPDGMYGLSKATHERVLRAYDKAGIIDATICRFFTVFGTRMKENHFILASIAKTFIKTDPFYVWGTGTEVRNFTPVQNTVDGFLLAIEKSHGKIYNIGLEQRITINDALEMIWKLMDWKPKDIVYQPHKPVGIRNRVADCTKARTELGWTPKISFRDGLQDTIDWYVSTHNINEVKTTLEQSLVNR